MVKITLKIYFVPGDGEWVSYTILLLRPFDDNSYIKINIKNTKNP